MVPLEFDEAGHRYTLDGLEVPSVTQVIGFLNNYSGIPPAVMELARDRGDAVHFATALHDGNDLDVESLDPRIAPYLAAWIRFRFDIDFDPVHIEQRVVSLKHRYAGTLDRMGLIRCGSRAKAALVDIKCTAALPLSAGPQTAAYDLAARESVDGWPLRVQRYTVQLRPDGTYRMTEHANPGDAGVFLSALNLHNWRLKHAS